MQLIRRIRFLPWSLLLSVWRSKRNIKLRSLVIQVISNWLLLLYVASRQTLNFRESDSVFVASSIKFISTYQMQPRFRSGRNVLLSGYCLSNAAFYLTCRNLKTGRVFVKKVYESSRKRTGDTESGTLWCVPRQACGHFRNDRSSFDSRLGVQDMYFGEDCSN